MKGKTIRIIEDIRKYREKNYPDKEIQHTLGLTDRMWQRYNKLVNDADKAAWLNITRTQLEPELINLKQSLEDTYRVAKEEVEKAKTTEERLLACESKDGARLDIIRLITEGPDYVKKVDEYVTEKDSKKTPVTTKQTTV